MLLSACGSGTDVRPTSPGRAVGVTLNDGPGGQTQAYRLFAGAGANALEEAEPWSTLEPMPNRYRLANVRDLVRGVRSSPADRLLVIPAVIETSARSVSGGLDHAAWDSPRMLTRYRRLIDRLAPELSRQVAYVSIANEADVYFAAHPRELDAFRRFAAVAIAELHRRAPWVKVGVTITYDGLVGPSAAVARELTGLGDVTVVTYYPLGRGYEVRSPQSPLSDLPALVRLVHGRQVVVQEAGYPTASRLRASPDAQATFVRAVFTAWNRMPDAVPFLSFYTLFDLPESECRLETSATAFFCSLGLREATGRPKPAWAQFVGGVRGIR
jgi:hypothetical protein